MALVLSVGEYAKEFFEEDIVVFFGKQAPSELQEHSVVIDHANAPTADIVVGDILQVANTRLAVTAVGPLVNVNFRELGHLVVKLNGSSTAEMDGDLNVAGSAIFKPQQGDTFSILHPQITS